ncbi:MAG: trimeric intracellular cation channel family protein [Terricaulis sp.]
MPTDVALTLPPALDYAGVAVFALTGALAAARDRHDIITFLFFAVVTGVGGGTLRDLLIGAPVFWIQDPAYLAVGGAAAVVVWVLGERLARSSALLWLDAVGLGLYAVIGAGKAMAFGVHPLVAVAMGVLTATFGGVLRDVLAGQPSILLKREIYVTAALLAAIAFAVLSALHVPPLWAGAAGALLGFGVRAGAIHWGWSMPAFGARGDGGGPEA